MAAEEGTISRETMEGFPEEVTSELQTVRRSGGSSSGCRQGRVLQAEEEG